MKHPMIYSALMRGDMTDAVAKIAEFVQYQENNYNQNLEKAQSEITKLTYRLDSAAVESNTQRVQIDKLQEQVDELKKELSSKTTKAKAPKTEPEA